MANDIDPEETREWLDAIASVLEFEGPERASYLLNQILKFASKKGCSVGETLNTPYVNTIPVEKQPTLPGDPEMEQRIRALIRWNAAIMVVRAYNFDPDLGGAYRHLRFSRHLVRYWIQSFLACAQQKSWGRFNLYSRPFFTGYLCEILSGRGAF